MANDTLIRVLQDPALDGPANMARDEVLMNFVGQGISPATLRLYEWSPPTISLGYFQPYEAYAQLPDPAGAMPVVRRNTGGGAILHDAELTYSFTLPVGHALVGGKPKCLYDAVHRAVISTLADLGIVARRSGMTDDSGPARGPFFCFARRHEADVLVGDEKIAGSAQRRTRVAILQHGSIVLSNRNVQQPSPDLGSQSVLESRQVSTPLLRHLAAEFACVFKVGTWTAEEHSATKDLVSKYEGDAWTKRV